MKTHRLRKFKIVPGAQYGTPKEVWGFRTAKMRGHPQDIAKSLFAANEDLFGLKKIRLGRPRIVESLGAQHIIYQQRVDGMRVYRAYVTAHVARDGSVYLVKNRAVPANYTLPEAPFSLSRQEAQHRALRSVSSHGKQLTVMDIEKIWFPRKKTLRPSYRVRVHRVKPRQDWIIYVDGATGKVLRRYDNLAARTAKARVFDPNPVIALGGADKLVEGQKFVPPPTKAYRSVTLRNLRANGYLDGQRVTTKPTRRRVRSSTGDFIFDSKHRAFEEVMAYYHIDRAIAYLEALGYRDLKAIFHTPLPVDANGTEEDNSFYSPHERSLTFGLGGVDDAEDAEIILHELGHAIQDAICPGFGQSQEAAAMGEGFGDYFSASFFADRKPERYRTSVGTWDAVRSHDNDPPCIRRVDEPLTYESFDHAADADEHVNGMIWSATLWNIRTAIGRDVADQIIIESHFQLDGFTTFARGARAIIDADRNVNNGRHAERLRQIFRQRGIGPVE